jgi:hypothetical protein
VGSPDFFRRRWDFISDNVARHGRFFSFRLLQHQVFCVASGADARKTYFSSPEHTVSFMQGTQDARTKLAALLQNINERSLGGCCMV